MARPTPLGRVPQILTAVHRRGRCIHAVSRLGRRRSPSGQGPWPLAVLRCPQSPRSTKAAPQASASWRVESGLDQGSVRLAASSAGNGSCRAAGGPEPAIGSAPWVAGIGDVRRRHEQGGLDDGCGAPCRVWGRCCPVRHGVAAQAVGDQDHWPGCRPHGGIRGGYPFLPVGVIPVALLDGFGPRGCPGPSGPASGLGSGTGTRRALGQLAGGLRRGDLRALPGVAARLVAADDSHRVQGCRSRDLIT